MCALHSKLHVGLAVAPNRARGVPAVVRSGHQQRVVVAAASKWKVFGPTNSYSDGDAEFYRVSNSLAQQYEWFAPRPEEQGNAAAEEELEQQDPKKPLYGLTPQQIAALGLTGARVNTPDPVSLHAGSSWSPGVSGSSSSTHSCICHTSCAVVAWSAHHADLVPTTQRSYSVLWNNTAAAHHLAAGPLQRQQLTAHTAPA